MKHLVILALVCLFAAPLMAADLPQGAYEIKIEGSYDLNNHDDEENLSALGALGYFPVDNLQLGGYMSLEKKPWESYWGVSDVWGLGIYGEYTINCGDAIVPYLGANLGFLDGSDSSGDTAFVGGATLGLRVFLTETVSLTAHLIYNFANDDIFDFERELTGVETEIIGEGENSDLYAGIGIRVLLL